MARIVSVYTDALNHGSVNNRRLTAYDMAYLRWFKVAEALARHGHQVDLAVPDAVAGWARESTSTLINLVPLSSIDWHHYDVIKTVFHQGFETLAKYGGADHPYIVSKLGSVVGPQDREGIYFYGDTRAQLYATQQQIADASRYITVLSEAARTLWIDCHGRGRDVLLVPGGVDRVIPARGDDPYPENTSRRCLFAGNIYDRDSQPEANRVLSNKLNRLGARLKEHDIQVCFLGHGDTTCFDPDCVINLGTVAYEQSWDYLYHANVGVVVSAGSFMHNNESSKIYHYLRAGLPVVSESGFPNDYLLPESGGGFLVDNEDMQSMADRIVEAADGTWNRERMMQYVLDQHSWERRVQAYADVIADTTPPL